MNKIIKHETAQDIHGLAARAFNVVAADDGRILNQEITLSTVYAENGRSYNIAAQLRFDDQCGNGHETFAITADIREDGSEYMSGCCHEEVARRFPTLAPLIKWHLFSTDGPMHYPENALFFAGNRDCWGRAKGDVSSWEYGLRFNDSPITQRVQESFYKFLKARYGTGPFIRSEFAHDKDPKTYGTHYSVQGFADRWHFCPFRDKTKADEFIKALNTCSVEFVKVPVAWSDGKERELDSARAVACWPNATDGDLCAPDLEDKLMARLPGLLEEFKAAMVGAGFVWPTRTEKVPA